MSVITGLAMLPVTVLLIDGEIKLFIMLKSRDWYQEDDLLMTVWQFFSLSTAAPTSLLPFLDARKIHVRQEKNYVAFRDHSG